VLDGVHLLDSLLASGSAPEWGVVSAAALARAEIAAAVARAEGRGTEWFQVEEGLLRAVAPTQHPSGVLAVFPLPRVLSSVGKGFVLLLEDIQDPGNLGTLLRSAHGAGVAQVALSRGCAEPWAPKVLRAAMGAHFSLRLLEDQDLTVVARRHGGVLAAAADGSLQAWQADLAGAVVPDRIGSCQSAVVGGRAPGCAGSTRVDGRTARREGFRGRRSDPGRGSPATSTATSVRRP